MAPLGVSFHLQIEDQGLVLVPVDSKQFMLCPWAMSFFQKLGPASFPPVSESESEVAQSCPTLCDPVDCSLPGSSIHGIFQARVLEWVAISFSRGSSQPRDQSRVFCIAGRRFTVWATRASATSGEFRGQRSLVAYSPWGCKELDTVEQLFFFLMWWLVLCVSLAGQHYPVISSNMTLSAAVKMFCGYG